MPTPIRLAQLGRGRKWAEHVAETGKGIPIVDEEGREVAWLIPATEPVTEALLDELVQSGLWPRENLDYFQLRGGDVRFRYHRAQNAFVSR
jgi:hypothetical protein